MEKAKSPARKLAHHIFVCMNERPPGHPRGCCKEKDSEALLKAFKEAVAATGKPVEVRAQKSGCLDVCEYGAAAVIYPEGVWYGGLKPSDAERIVRAHLAGDQAAGKSVESLRIPGK